MPMFMDIHSVPGASADDLRHAHDADMAIQHKHGVNCLKYWLNEEAGKVFCLFDAPNAEAANAVHREAHGLLAEKIIEIDADMVDGGRALSRQGLQFDSLAPAVLKGFAEPISIRAVRVEC